MERVWASTWASITDDLNSLLSEWQRQQAPNIDPSEVEIVRKEFSTFRDHLMRLVIRQERKSAHTPVTPTSTTSR